MASVAGVSIWKWTTWAGPFNLSLLEAAGRNSWNRFHL
jgi:hypothetical protein